MFFLDLAVPRDVEASVADIYNVFAYELNDLESVAEENRVRRAREVPRAEAILEEELTRFLAWFGNLAVVPTLTDLRRRMEEIRDAELARLPETEGQRFRQAAEAMFSKLLNELTRGLKSEEDPARKFDRVEAIRHVFGLDRGRR
jgi:glutamyl-tRNA reductase